MREALALGETADKEGDMGVGSVIVRDGKVIGRGRNRMHSRRDPLIHAETDAIADACKALDTDDLSGSTLYTTMEPCPMCAGAMMNAKIGHWVMGGRFKAVGRRTATTRSRASSSSSTPTSRSPPASCPRNARRCATATTRDAERAPHATAAGPRVSGSGGNRSRNQASGRRRGPSIGALRCIASFVPTIGGS